jgi:hypothetical protein
MNVGGIGEIDSRAGLNEDPDTTRSNPRSRRYMAIQLQIDLYPSVQGRLRIESCAAAQLLDKVFATHPHRGSSARSALAGEGRAAVATARFALLCQCLPTYYDCHRAPALWPLLQALHEPTPFRFCAHRLCSRVLGFPNPTAPNKRRPNLLISLRPTGCGWSVSGATPPKRTKSPAGGSDRELPSSSQLRRRN